MQPTCFIRKFKDAFGMSPQNYFRRLKLFKAKNVTQPPANTEKLFKNNKNTVDSQ